MQNQIINFELNDGTVDKFIPINPTKQQIFSIAKEESQMFPSSDYNYSGVIPAGFTNDPMWQTENRDSLIATSTDPHINSSWTPIDYIGLTQYSVPTLIDESFMDVFLFNPRTGDMSPFYTGTGNLTNMLNGFQLMRVPAHAFDTILTDPDEIAENGGNNIKTNHDTYYLIVKPKYIETTLSLVSARMHYEWANKSYNIMSLGTTVRPSNKRRWEYIVPNDDFRGTPWNFEAHPTQVGRLLGSVVELWNSSGTVLKQTKVMNENDFGFNTGSLMKFVMSPDNVGYDPLNKQIGYGDIIRVYPRETYFNQFIIKLDYVDSTKSIKAALDFMLNDVARDMKTGIYEVYDDNGFTIDSSGNFSGNVISKYQISQYGQYEIRKKLNS